VVESFVGGGGDNSGKRKGKKDQEKKKKEFRYRKFKTQGMERRRQVPEAQMSKKKRRTSKK